MLQVGCGGISRRWVEAALGLPDLELVGLVDMVKSSAQQLAEDYALAVPIGTDLASSLAQLAPELVFDCTVPSAHAEVTLAALAAGCHVFGEKPLADTLADAQRVVRAAQASGKTYAVMQNRRYDPNLRAVKALLASGVIGELTTVNADFYLAAHFGGFREQMPHVLVKDMAIHTFDAARFLSGRDAEAVYCHEWNPAGSWYDRDAAATAIFELQGGAVFTYRGSWCAEGLHTPWESEWRFVGTRGSVLWDGATGLRCESVERPEGFIYAHTARPVPALEPSRGDVWHAAAIQAFVSDLRAGREPETVCSDNLASLAMVLGAAESAETKRRVVLGAFAEVE